MPLKPCKKTETQPACDLSHAIQLASLIDTCVLDHGEKTKCTGSDTICSHLPHLAKDFFFFFTTLFSLLVLSASQSERAYNT